MTMTLQTRTNLNQVRHFSVTNSQDFMLQHHDCVKNYISSRMISNISQEKAIQRAQALSQRFYRTANTSGNTVIYEVVGYGRSELVTPARIYAYQTQIWGSIFDFGAKIELLELLAFVNAEMYLPMPFTLIQINNAVYFNTYVPPESIPCVVANLVYNSGLSTARPPLWQEFLDRWFPSNVDVQNVLEAYIAKLIFDPLYRPHFCMVVRSDQGTGKNFLTETVLSPLLGDKNVMPTSLDKLVSRFNGSLFSNKLIVLNEVDNDRKGTYTKLKDKITDNVITVEEKYKNPRMQSIYSGIFVFSNEDIPLYIDEDDRRFYVTPRLVNKVSREETREFISKFADWLSEVQYSFDTAEKPYGDGLYSAEKSHAISGATIGLDILAAWLKNISQEGYHDVNFRDLPTLGNCCSEMKVGNPSLELESNLSARLVEEEAQGLVWQITAIRKFSSDYKLLKEGTIKRLLEEAGFSSSENCWIKEQGKTKRVRGYRYKGSGTTANPCTGFGSMTSDFH